MSVYKAPLRDMRFVLHDLAGLAEFAQRAKQNWARLIRKVYEADPLECPKCRSVKSGPMRLNRVDRRSDRGAREAAQKQGGRSSRAPALA